VKLMKSRAALRPGETQITPGFNLPSTYVLHTVGPRDRSPVALQNCYSSCLDLCVKHKIRSLAQCCVSTGIFGYPNFDAAVVALRTTREWFDAHRQQQDGHEKAVYPLDRMLFCLFLQEDIDIYRALMPIFFPLVAKPQQQHEEDASPLDAAAPSSLGGEKLPNNAEARVGQIAEQLNGVELKGSEDKLEGQ
jgi:hypothetical protein